jgi:hypothetical protein
MSIKNGDKGDAVREVERLLVQQGYNLKEDSLFDANTEQAVKSFQRDKGLVIDGIVGEKTLQTLRTRNKNPKLLTHGDIVKAAATLNVEVAAVLAVNEVESQGSGFFEDGRVKILFERHVMYRRLKAAEYDADSFASKYPKLVNITPGGYRGGWPEYTRLKSAQVIDHDIALESCSWGQFQIMGYHWLALGYASIQAFVESMGKSEAAQLEAFVKFIQADPALHKALKSRKWADFARIYNGPSYKNNLYDIKLARAYERYAEDNALPEAA